MGSNTVICKLKQRPLLPPSVVVAHCVDGLAAKVFKQLMQKQCDTHSSVTLKYCFVMQVCIFSFRCTRCFMGSVIFNNKSVKLVSVSGLWYLTREPYSYSALIQKQSFFHYLKTPITPFMLNYLEANCITLICNK